MLNTIKIAKILKDNNYKLLGQIEVSDTEYNELLAITSMRLKNNNFSSITEPDLVLSLTLVQIAIRRYQDGKFWDCFMKEIGYEIPDSRKNNIGKIFYKTLEIYGLFIPRYENKSYQYVEYIKAHAFITNFYAQRFYDFAYAYYNNNLLRQINSDDIEEDFEDLSKYMKTTLQNEDDCIVETDLNKASKSYMLLKSTRAVLAFCDANTIKNIFLPILKLIDDYFFDDIVPQLGTNRHERSFTEWCKQQSQNKNQNKDSITEQRIKISHKPYISVSLDKEIAYLVIPTQKYRDEDCNGYVSVTVEINGYIEKKELEVYKSFGLYLTEEKRLLIPSVFDEINITITSINEKKYKIRKSDYRIFDRQWKNKNKFDIGHNYILVRHGILAKWKDSSNEVDRYEEYKNWQFISALIDEKSILHIGDKPISVIGEFSTTPIFERKIEYFKAFDMEEKQITISREHPALSFVIEKSKINGSVLIINDIKYPIQAIPEKACFDCPWDNDKLAVSVLLNSVLPVEDKRYDVYLDVPGDNLKYICGYLILKRFNYRFNKPRYMYDEKAVLKITKGEYLFEPVTPCTLNYESEKSISYDINLDNNPEKFELILELTEKYRIEIPIMIFKYGFSETLMESQKKEYIWYSDLKEMLYVSIPGASEVSACYKEDDSDEIKKQGVKVFAGTFRIDISEIVRMIKDGTQIYCKICLEYIDNEKRRIRLPEILRRPVIEPYFHFLVENSIPYVDLRIKGRADVFVNIEDSNGEIVVKERQVVEGKNIFPELEPRKSYKILPYAKENVGFFFKTTPLKERRIAAYIDLNNLELCDFIVEKICVNNEKKELIDEHYVSLRQKIGEDKYRGTIYIRKKQYKNNNCNNARGGPPMMSLGLADIDCKIIDNQIFFYLNDSNNMKEEENIYFDQTKKELIVKRAREKYKDGLFKDRSYEYRGAYKQIPKMKSSACCACCDSVLKKRVSSYIYIYNEKENTNKIIQINLFVCEKCGIKYANQDIYLQIRTRWPGYRAVSFYTEDNDNAFNVNNKVNIFPVKALKAVENTNDIKTMEKQKIILVSSISKVRPR